MRRGYILVAIVVVALAAVTIVVAKPGLRTHRLELRAYFKDVMGLRAGALVRVAGVEVGNVKSVRARPEVKDNPGEAVLRIETSYPLQIPSDAVASIQTAGLLGGTFVEIDVSGTRGMPLRDGGTIQVKEPLQFRQDFLEQLLNGVLFPDKNFVCASDAEMKHLDCKAIPADAKMLKKSSADHRDPR